MTKSLRFILLIISASLIVGCGPAKIIEPKTFNLVASSQLKLARSPSSYTLKVGRPEASEAYRTRDMRYVNEPYQLGTFVKHAWVARPTNMLESLLVQSLQNTGYYRAVVNHQDSADTTFRLNTTLLALEQNFLNRPSQVHVVIKATLVNESNDKIIASKRFSKTSPTKANTPYAGVIAANEAVKSVLQDIARFAVRYSH